MSQPATQTRQDLPEPAFLADPGLRLDLPEPSPRAATERLVGYLRLLWQERRVIARVALAGVALGTVLAFVLPKRYESTVQLMPPDAQPASGAMLAALSARAGGGIGAMAGDLLNGKSTGVLFIGILRSRTLEDRLVERFDLRREYGERLAQEARRQLAANTAIYEDRKSGILSLTVVDRDPNRAAALAQAYAEELERLVSELSTSSARRERLFLEARLKVVKQELDQASEDFSRFASQNTAINIPEQGKAMVEAAAVLEGQVIAAESELKGLSEIYTPNNVRVRSVQARVSELRRQLEKLDGDTGAAEPGRPSGEGSAYPTIRQLPLLGVPYADLLRRTKIEEAVYETLTQQYELAKVQEVKETPSVKVLDAAVVPERRSSPARLPLIFFSALIGLAAGSLGIILRSRWQLVDATNPGKKLAEEVLLALSERCSGFLRWSHRRTRSSLGASQLPERRR